MISESSRIPAGWLQPQIDLGMSGDADGAVFGQREVLRLTGVTYRQLDTWARNGILDPSVQTATGSGTRRLYSFRDIVALRMLKRLTDAGVSLQKVRLAVEMLRKLGEAELSAVVLISDGTTVYQCRSDDEVIDLVHGGQIVFAIALKHILADLSTARASRVVPAPALAAASAARAQSAAPRVPRRRPQAAATALPLAAAG